MLFHSLRDAFVITFFVINMMIVAEYLNLLSERRLFSLLKDKSLLSYVFSSFLGALPGCLGPFAVVSLYMHGFLSFGAVMASMIATSGDESYLMLSLFPVKAIYLFLILFIAGVFFGWLSDKLLKVFGFGIYSMSRCGFNCECGNPHSVSVRPSFSVLRKGNLKRYVILLILLFFTLSLLYLDFGDEGWMKLTLIAIGAFSLFILATAPDHYVEHNIIDHVIFKHSWRILLWVFGSLVLLEFLVESWNIASFIERHGGIMFPLSALVGLIPESGPHIFFTLGYARGVIPFSVLFLNSFVQDGHGLLPLFSHSFKIALLLKLLKLFYGLALGGVLYLLGF